MKGTWFWSLLEQLGSYVPWSWPKKKLESIFILVIELPWDFFGRNDAKAETPVLWPPHVKSWLIGKDSDAGRDWGQEEKGTTKDEMAGWHHWLDGHESGWTLGVGDGQGGLACCDSWGRRQLDTTEWLNWTELNWISKNIDFKWRSLCDILGIINPVFWGIICNVSYRTF